MSRKGQPGSKAEKLLRPATQFNEPAEILDDAELSENEKKAALDTWEQDARQLMTASNEGMAGKREGADADHHRMGEVGRAKSRMGAKPKHKPSH
jgi:hypothetical protein